MKKQSIYYYETKGLLTALVVMLAIAAFHYITSLQLLWLTAERVWQLFIFSGAIAAIFFVLLLHKKVSALKKLTNKSC